MRDEAEIERIKRHPLYQEAVDYVNANKKDILEQIKKGKTFETQKPN